ncbi:T9SS type A sorting domain-containing protein [Dyadobacter sp. CY312]|uniref:T9SS type A sorting domain-containing protein n=1 Tax=Dyadobacter sp. CY312 TaxID=2907303 RepID=UPI001F222398|nr:T9SS type A sorting domain-containing protein [Dyadobacter sp. CY312]MCE7044631.1 T9SS type A sorting domain-containing protein [Dyadobacter sp. CY312]
MKTTTHNIKFKKSKILLSLLLISLAMSMGSLAIAQGYIYVHSKTLNEAGSPPITYTVSGGSTAIPSFTLNDDPTQTILNDIGASQNGRLWAVSDANELYYRDALSPNWIKTSITGVRRVDGGPNGTCFYINTSGTGFSYTGSGSATQISATGQFSSSSADIGSGWTATPYIVNNGSIVYKYSGSGTSWNTYSTISGNSLYRIDVNPSNGNVYVGASNGTTRTIREITPALAVSNLGNPGGSTEYYRDLAVNENGEIYATAYTDSAPFGWYVHKFSSGTAWVRELGSFDGSNLTGGVGNSLWLTMNSGGWNNDNGPYPFYNIFSRGFDGTVATYIDDERVRTAPAAGNSQLIPVAPGTYTITETVPGGWSLQKITVYDPSANSSVNVGTRSAIVTVAAGEVVHVVFQTGEINPFNMTTDCANAYLETFGTGAVGSYGSPVDGQTTYHYLTGNAPGEDGHYKIVNRANPDFNTWDGAAGIVDHTPSDGALGYMYAVNAGYDKGEFFRRHFTGVISGANYSFSAWIVNLTASASVNPNVTFTILDHATQAILGVYNTGDLASNTEPGTWQKYGFDFIGGSSSDIDLVISNNGIGGNGNDLAIDDISFSLAPPTPTIVVENGSCTSGQGSITVTSPLSADYEYSVDGTTWQATTSFANLATGAYTVYVRFANTTNCTNGVTSATINPSICGNVFHDANGLNDSQVNGTPINMAGTTPLYVSLYDGATLVSTIPVAADGAYEFVNTTIGTTYTVVLGTNSVANATSPFAGTGTGGWETVGEDCCDNTGGDGTTNGSLTITVGASNTNANFGIELQPQSDEHTTTIPQPATNDVLTLNGVGTNPPLLSGSDPEDGTYSGATGTVTNPTGVIITSLPANGVLNYNGTPVTVGQTIANPALLTIVLTGTGYTSVSFNYAYVDAANVDDPSPATYTVSWTGALPVTLINFEVTKSESQVRISWATSSETNSSYFDVERSTDARTWNVIGKVSAKENKDALTEYNFTDATPAQTTNYYRLKMVDQDQSFAYSKIRSVSFEGVNLRMYPNPATSELHIDNVDFNQIQKIVLYATTGNAVYENTGVIKPSINVSRFNSGTYILTITLKNGEKISRTVVKN